MCCYFKLTNFCLLHKIWAQFDKGKIFMRSILLTSILVVTAFLTSACNTMQGAGQDMQSAGKKLEESAEENKSKKSCGCH